MLPRPSRTQGVPPSTSFRGIATPCGIRPSGVLCFSRPGARGVVGASYQLTEIEQVGGDVHDLQPLGVSFVEVDQLFGQRGETAKTVGPGRLSK